MRIFRKGPSKVTIAVESLHLERRGSLPDSFTVVIPAMDEDQVIRSVVADLRTTLGPAVDIVVVDDGSSDSTVAEALAGGARIVSIPYNMGNGAAVKAGVRAATGDFVAIIDGDGQHRAADLVKLLEHAGPYDMVVGARSAEGQASLGRRLANGFFNRLASYMTGRRIADLTSGMRVIRTSIAREFLPLLPNGFSTPTTLTMASIRSGYSVLYIPVDVRNRVGASKLKVWRDGLKFLTIIFKISTLFNPLKVFVPLAFILGAASIAAFIAGFISGGIVWILSAVGSVGAIVLLSLGLISEQICSMRYERIHIHAEEKLHLASLQESMEERA